MKIVRCLGCLPCDDLCLRFVQRGSHELFGKGLPALDAALHPSCFGKVGCRWIWAPSTFLRIEIPAVRSLLAYSILTPRSLFKHKKKIKPCLNPKPQTQQALAHVHFPRDARSSVSLSARPWCSTSQTFGRWRLGRENGGGCRVGGLGWEV